MASITALRRFAGTGSLSNIFARIQPIVANYSKLVEVDKEVVTHTGQVFDKNDRRRARFIDREKEASNHQDIKIIHLCSANLSQVNERFAIDLINEVPPIKVKGRHVWCDGGNSALGHPKVYINLDSPGPQICAYCGLRYIRED
ncbi:NADH dehydrogenase [ubiquinone] iron-sulfur protein 6, mitochondrial [Trichoplax sp. H2]|nr:NADH dehydrogenase [ubiquinone] iron-sulfur protein 6, mitochondrial [Trichoplax sp. H2]|eukprot:RDD46980.1 NADH dehydrogenase [ubiquinone] iron-sulfur protein 6, mitochondrial [Trichoplax sp. H2]